MTEAEFNQKIAELNAAITCEDVCELVSFIKQHGTAAQLAAACAIAADKECECDECEESTGGPG
jgi:hypothetical protein